MTPDFSPPHRHEEARRRFEPRRPRGGTAAGASAAAIALLIAVALGAVARAQTDGPPIVRAVVVKNAGAGRLDEGFVRARVASREGQPLDARAVARDVKALLDSQAFSAVTSELEPAVDGVRLVYSLVPRLRLASPVEVSGVKHFSEEKIRDLVGLRQGDLVDDQEVGVRLLKVEEKYREAMYPDADASGVVEETDRAEGLARVRVRIEEGRRSRVRDITFSGNGAVGAAELWQLAEPRAWWVPTRWFERRRYDPEQLERLRIRIAEFYRDRGFLDVVVDAPELKRDEDGIAVNFAIREGPSYRFGKVELAGVSRFPTAEVWRVVTVAPGRPASAGGVARAARDIEEFYGSRGYINARVRVARDADARRAALDVRFDVAEGNLAYVRNIRIEGNGRTRDKVIRRELLVYPGDVFDRAKVRRSERRVSNLGYFSSVRSQALDTDVPEQKDLAFEVEEKRTGQFMVGAGFSSIDNLMGFVEVQQGNFDLCGWPAFTGGGQKLKLRAQWGEKRRSYELSFVEPWFLDQQLSLGFDLYLTDRNYRDYDVERTGGAISLVKPLPGPNRVQVRYELESTAITDVSDTNEYFFVESPDETYSFVREEETVLKSTIGVSLQHDTRDNAFVPTRGNRASLSADISGGLLGGTADIYSLGLRTGHYLPLWWRHVLSLRLRYQVVDAYDGSDEVPIDDRLFAGGGMTLRGFEYRDVGPKVRPVGAAPEDERHRPVGGRSLALASVEYTMPLVANIRLAAFYDIGNVWREAYELDLADLASSAGIGVRFDIPGFPIRVDYAWPIHADDELTDEDPWVIWIGFDY